MKGGGATWADEADEGLYMVVGRERPPGWTRREQRLGRCLTLAWTYHSRQKSNHNLISHNATPDARLPSPPRPFSYVSVRPPSRPGRCRGERASRGGPSSSLWSDERSRWLPTPALPSAPLTSNSFRLSASIFCGKHVSANSRSSPLNSAILSQHPSTASSSERSLSDAFAPSTPAHYRRPGEVGGPQASCVVFRPRSTAAAKRVHPGVLQNALPPS